jgi:hypothetical protein
MGTGIEAHGLADLDVQQALHGLIVDTLWPLSTLQPRHKVPSGLK